ncbi:hypothetical protein DR64_6226 [Paraburkholderia xenovorans LB400]|nr:hypothetical protein DR64_6226 [Paraburkholderia xenovorans LB400]
MLAQNVALVCGAAGCLDGSRDDGEHGNVPVAFGEQHVARFQPAPFAVALQYRELGFIEPWENLMVTAAACHQVFKSA